jgi:hypothetical protein
MLQQASLFCWFGFQRGNCGHSNNAFERTVNRHRVRAANAARHHALPARSRAHCAAAQRVR